MGNVVIPAAVGDRTVGVAAAAAAAAAAAWNVPSNGARDRQQSRANYLVAAACVSNIAPARSH